MKEYGQPRAELAEQTNRATMLGLHKPQQQDRKCQGKEVVRTGRISLHSHDSNHGLTLSWTVNVKTISDPEALMQDGHKQGYRHFNIKVAPDPKFDLDLAKTVRRCAPSVTKIFDELSVDVTLFADMATVTPNSRNIGRAKIGAAVSHPSSDDLELYSLDMIHEEGHLAKVEEHLLTCGDCVDRAIQIEDWVRTMKTALSIEAREDSGCGDRGACRIC